MKLEQWAQWAEIVASVAVVVTLVVLAGEVQSNTKAIERQADLDRAAALTSPFFEAPQLASILAQIKAVDGADPLPQALADRYGLTPEQAILWERHLWLVWLQHEAEFNRSGATGELAGWVSAALRTPDGRIYWDVRGPLAEPGFRAFVDGLAAGVPR